jgi:hypothetical protein
MEIEIDAGTLEAGIGRGGAGWILLLDGFERTQCVHPVGTVLTFIGGFLQVGKTFLGDSVFATSL